MCLWLSYIIKILFASLNSLKKGVASECHESPTLLLGVHFFVSSTFTSVNLLSGKPWPEVKAHVNKISAGTFQNIGRSGDSYCKTVN